MAALTAEYPSIGRCLHFGFSVDYPCSDDHGHHLTHFRSSCFRFWTNSLWYVRQVAPPCTGLRRLTAVLPRLQFSSSSNFLILGRVHLIFVLIAAFYSISAAQIFVSPIDGRITRWIWVQNHSPQYSEPIHFLHVNPSDTTRTCAGAGLHPS